MNMKFNFKLLIIIPVVVIGISCEDFLDREPLNVVSDEDDAIYQAVHYDIEGEVTKSEGELIIEKISDDGVEGSFEMTIHKPNDDLSDIKEVEISKGEFDVTLYQFKDKKLVK